MEKAMKKNLLSLAIGACASAVISARTAGVVVRETSGSARARLRQAQPERSIESVID